MSQSRSDLHVVAIIQARMGSTRLPGKILKDIEGQPMIARVHERAARAEKIDQLMIATTTESSDDRLAEYGLERGYEIYRGHATDVLDRYLGASIKTSADVIVRLTGDCPLIDPQVIDRTVAEFLQAWPEVDYASNRILRTYPIGLDVEVMTMKAIKIAAGEAVEPYEREHVTPYFYDRPDRFRVLSVESGRDLGSERWTVDTEEDLDFVRQVYRRFENDDRFLMDDVLALLEREPELRTINRHIPQKDYHQAG